MTLMKKVIGPVYYYSCHFISIMLRQLIGLQVFIPNTNYLLKKSIYLSAQCSIVYGFSSLKSIAPIFNSS